MFVTPHIPYIESVHCSLNNCENTHRITPHNVVVWIVDQFIWVNLIHNRIIINWRNFWCLTRSITSSWLTNPFLATVFMEIARRNNLFVRFVFLALYLDRVVTIRIA